MCTRPGALEIAARAATASAAPAASVLRPECLLAVIVCVLERGLQRLVRDAAEIDAHPARPSAPVGQDGRRRAGGRRGEQRARRRRTVAAEALSRNALDEVAHYDRAPLFLRPLDEALRLATVRPFDDDDLPREAEAPFLDDDALLRDEPLLLADDALLRDDEPLLFFDDDRELPDDEPLLRGATTSHSTRRTGCGYATRRTKPNANGWRPACA